MASPHWITSHPRVLRFLLLTAILSLSLALILGLQLLPSRYKVREGEVAAQTVKSPISASFLSQVKTEERRREVEASVAEFFVYDAQLARTQREKLGEIERQGLAIIKAESLSTEQKRNAMANPGGIELSPRALDLFLTFRPEEWQGVIAESTRLLEAAYSRRLTQEEVASLRADLAQEVEPSLKPEQAVVALEIVRGLLKPSMLPDREATARARAAARARVEPVIATLSPGETIVRDGQVVGPFEMEQLRAAGLLNPPLRWQSLSAVALQTTTISLLLSSYILLFQPRLLHNNRRLLLLIFMMTGTVLAAKLTIPGRDMYALLFPVAAAPMLIASLLDAQLGILVAALLSILVSRAAGGNLQIPEAELLLVYLAGSLAGLLGTWKAERLNRYFLAGGGVAAANFAVILAFWLPQPGPDLMRLGLYGFVSLVNGGLAAALTLGTFALLGAIFGITTRLHLLELAQPDQPLLRRLLLEAPGTYHHSLMVGNLAERAADMIGADPLLARVGAYYHDIGKILRPAFFVENQMEGQNIHDDLDPLTSARIIASHVTDGLQLARQHRLPPKVRDFIAEHHGTRLVTYFYHMAREGQQGVDPEQYRYPGPRPQTKETALVMLADSVEALVRGSRKRSTEEIEELANKAVADRLAEGELDECDLTIRDLDLVKQAFKITLRGFFHPRLEYPEPRPEWPTPRERGHSPHG